LKKVHFESRPTAGARHALRLFAVSTVFLVAGSVSAEPLPTTRNDFAMPGTQPLTVTDDFAIPGDCTSCHSDYGQPQVEPWRNWQGSMMAQSGRDPVTYAAMAIANQDATAAGETCIRCHMPKGWLEGRSVPEDATATTAADREGVQCAVCHRLVDPEATPGNPAEDAAILAALTAPVTVTGGAQMVVDPLDRLRGPFDIVADLGSDPHTPSRTTIVSQYHKSSRLCGTCHNVLNPAFTRQPDGSYALNDLDTPGDPALAFPEQSTYDEWLNSDYATTGVYAPQFGGNQPVVSTCQDCHMRAVSGKDANLGLRRDDLPLHDLVGANTFTPRIIPDHPVFGAEVDAEILEEGAQKAEALLRRSATLEADIEAGVLTVRVINETGHKLPTGYPDGRRMWLHVRAFDADRTVVFESGRYLSDEAQIVGYHAEPEDPGYDASLRVWEAEQGMDAAMAALSGNEEGAGFHLAINNVRVKDNRIPPRGFTNAAYEAFDGHPIGGTFADGQYWDDVEYPVGPSAVGAEITLYYQTLSKNYVEFLRDENVTNIAGPLLYDLWEANGKSAPVTMVRAWLEPDAKTVERCRKTVAKGRGKYLKAYDKRWSACFGQEVVGLSCSTGAVESELETDAAEFLDRVGGAGDSSCAGANLQPQTLGLGGYCPAPCGAVGIFDIAETGACAQCLAEAVVDAALEAGFGTTPFDGTPDTVPLGDARNCQRTLAKAASKLAASWVKALERCENAKLRGKLPVETDCTADPEGRIAKAKTKSSKQVGKCASFDSVPGCGEAGNATAVATCIEDTLADVVAAYVEVPYP
jgi:hypothetical protein